VLGWAGLDLTILRIASLFYENVPTLHGRSIRDEGRSATASATCASPDQRRGCRRDRLAALLHPERFEGGVVQYIRQGAELLSHAEVARVLSESSRGQSASSPSRARPAGRVLALAEAQPAER